eukprot:SAG22_NODE_7620_length_723_cov_0.727564_1_plen_73_part_01
MAASPQTAATDISAALGTLHELIDWRREGLLLQSEFGAAKRMLLEPRGNAATAAMGGVLARLGTLGQQIQWFQ